MALDNVDSHAQSNAEFHAQKKPLNAIKVMLSSKRVALAALSVNLNNLVTTPVFAVFKMLEGVLLMYCLAVIIQSQVTMSPIKDTWLIEAYLYELPELDLIIIQSCMLALQLLLVVLWIACCHQKDSLAKVKESTFIPSCISVVQYSLWTYLSIPYLQFMIRTFFMTLNTDTLSMFIGIQCLNAINVIFFISIQFFLLRVSTLKLPLFRTPQAQLDHRSIVIRLLLKASYVLIQVLLSRLSYLAQYLNIISIIILIITLGTCLFRLMVVPMYCKSVNVIINMTNWMALVCSFIIVINTFDAEVDHMNLYYLAILSPFLLGTSFLIEYHWQHRILSRIRDQSSKMEMQYSYMLYLLQEQIHNLKGNKNQVNESLKFLFGILEDHNGECLKAQCLCHHAESLVWILNQKHDENQQIIDLNGDDIDFLNAITQDPLYNKDYSANAPFTFNDFQDKKCIIIKSQPRATDNPYQVNDNVEFAFEDEKLDQQNDGKNDQLFKIDSLKLKQAFFAYFLRQYFEQGTQKFPQSIEIKIQYAYFALVYLRNVYLCINILKQVDPLKLSYFERCGFQLQESFLLHEIKNAIGKADVYRVGFEPGLLGVINMDKVKYSSSIDHSQLDSEGFLEYAKLQEMFNSTTQALSKHILQFWVLLYDQVLQVDKLMIEGAIVANYIAQTYETFRLMDEASKHKNEKIFFNFAIIHQQLLNDNQTYYLYIQKMKHIINMKKFIKKNYQLSDSYQDSGLLLVNGNFQSFGKILQSNKVFQFITGYNNQDLKYSSYEIIMNDMVKKWHGSFVNEFNRSGNNIILDKKLNQFIKKKNGYIIPVHLIVKNHFSKYHGYTFIAFINPIKEIQMDGSLSLGIPIEKLLFLLCDNFDGKIYNISKSCSQKLGLRSDQVMKNQSSLDLELKIGALSPALDISRIKELQSKYGNNLNDSVYYGITKLDLNALSQKSIGRFNALQLADSRFKLIMESYNHSKNEMNVLIMQIFDQEKDAQLYTTSGQLKVLQNPSEQSLQDHSLASREEQERQFEDVASSSSSDSSKPNDQIKSQSISMEKKIPRNLKIVTQMLFIMFCTMTVVSTINLYLSKSRSQKLYEEIDVVRKAFDRINFASRSRLMIREMLNIANGYEPNNTYILANRSKAFHAQLFEAQEELRLVQNYLDGTQGLFSEELQQKVSKEDSQLQYLDEQGSVYLKNHTMSYVVNIYVSKLLEIYNFMDAQLKGRLSIQSLTPQKLPFRPTDQESAIFFAVQNGNKVIQEFSMKYAEYYTQDIKSYSDDSINQTKITILISISTIVLVFVIVTPLLSMIQDRQYSSLAFFLQISKENIHKLIDQTKACYESLYRMDYSQMLDKGDQGQEDLQDSDQQNDESMPDNSLISMNVTSNPHNYTKNEQTISDNDGLMAAQAQGKQAISQTQSFANKFSIPPRQHHDDYSDSSFSSQEHPQVQNPQALAVNKVDDNDESQQEAVRVRQHEVISRKKQRRFRVIMLSFVFMMFFSLYFVGSYFMSYTTYSIVPQMIDDLNVIYFKDSCLENLIIYSKENMIQNLSFPLYSDQNKVASTYFIERCLEIEKAYTELRKGSSGAFKGVQDYIAAIETDQLCATVYSHDPVTKQMCSTAYNGMLQKGLSNAVSIIISNFNQMNLKFLGNKNRSAADLKNLNVDNDNLILIEMKVFIMDELFKQLKDKATESTSSYLSSQTNQYVIFFSAFILILVTLIILVFGVMFRRLRDYLWKLNLTMKILPLEHLTKDNIQDLKDFFKS